MANGNYSVLKDNIDDYIKQNGDGDITGQVLQTQLFAMITSLGAGYQFMGVAKLTPTPTDPGSPDQNVFYVAFQPGIYSNFGSQTVADGEIAILKWNGSWTKEVTGAASAAKLDELGQEVDNLGNDVDYLTRTAQDFEQVNDALDVYRGAPSQAAQTGTSYNGLVNTSTGQVQNSSAFELMCYPILRGQTIYIDAVITTIRANTAFCTYVEGTVKSGAAATTLRNMNTAGSYSGNYTAQADGYIVVQVAISGVATYSSLSVYQLVKGGFLTEFAKTLTGDAFTETGVLEKNGTITAAQTNWKCTPFIPFVPVGITTSGLNDSTYTASLCFYNKNKQFIAYSQTYNGTISADSIPQDAAYVVFCAKVSGLSSAKAVTAANATEITRRVNLQNYVKRILKATDASFGNGETLSLNTPIIRQHREIAFYGRFSAFGTLAIQSGTATFARCKIAVDGTNIYLYSATAGDFDTPIATYPHGLTLSTFVNIIIKGGKDGNAVVYLSTLGGEKEQAITNWATCYNTTQVKNTNCTMTDCVLTFSCDDLTKKCWIVGDSYMSYWVPLAQDKGYGNYLLCGRPGTASEEALQSLQYLLNIATPKMIVWAIGMNNADSGAINTTWQTCVESVMAICRENGIELVLVTAPNTPTKDNSYKNAYIAASGYRYVDISAAVGADLSTAWYTGLLGVDPHPSDAGSLVIANRYIADLPEMAD